MFEKSSDAVDAFGAGLGGDGDAGGARAADDAARGQEYGQLTTRWLRLSPVSPIRKIFLVWFAEGMVIKLVAAAYQVDRPAGMKIRIFAATLALFLAPAHLPTFADDAPVLVRDDV